MQYAFLELPKLPASKPETGAAQWAWLFVNARKLTEVPADLPPGPHRSALMLANKATFTQEELDAYQKVIDEIQQVRELVEAKRAEGFAEGEAAGFAKGKAAAVLAILAARGLHVTPVVRARIEACQEAATLDRWIGRAMTSASVDEVLEPSTRSA